MNNTLFVRTLVSPLFVFVIMMLPAQGQVYAEGDTISLEHQLLDLPICANGNGQEILHLADYNHNLNGGDRFILWLDIFSPT